MKVFQAVKNVFCNNDHVAQEYRASDKLFINKNSVW